MTPRKCKFNTMKECYEVMDVNNQGLRIDLDEFCSFIFLFFCVSVVGVKDSKMKQIAFHHVFDNST